MNEDIETALREAAATLPSAAPLDLQRVAGAGLLDVAYATVDSPLGPLVVAATPRGLVRLAYTGSRDEG